MNQNLSTLQEVIKQMVALRAEQEEETTRMRSRLEWLEGRRRELFDLVALQNGDFEARRKLEETESQIGEIRHTLTQAEADLKTSLHEIRQRILEMRNEELTRLEDESKALRRRKEEIHKVLMPEAVAREEALREEEKRLGQRGDEIARRIRELNQLDLETTQAP